MCAGHGTMKLYVLDYMRLQDTHPGRELGKDV